MMIIMIDYDFKNGLRSCELDSNIIDPSHIRNISSRKPISSDNMTKFPPTLVLKIAWEMNIDDFVFSPGTRYGYGSLLLL